MVAGTLSEVFGTLSIGFATILAALSVWWAIRYAGPFIAFIKDHPLRPTNLSTSAVWIIALFGFGLIVEDTTDHLTDAEYRTWSVTWLWPPTFQVWLLGDESEHRAASLFDTDQGHSKKLNRVGRQVFANPTLMRFGRRDAAPPDCPCPPEDRPAFDAEIEDLRTIVGDLGHYDAKPLRPTPKNDETPKGKAARELEHNNDLIRHLINHTYYHAKNWCYLQPTLFAELEGIQRRVDYARSIFLVASWVVLVSALGALFVLSFHALRVLLHRATQPPSIGRCPRRLLAIAAVAAAVGVMGKWGYDNAEGNFNKRVFGYWLTYHHQEESGISGSAVLWMQTSPEYVACCEQTYLAAAGALKADPKPFVVMDLDETVLDNTAYHAQRLLKGEDYSSDTWDEWEREVEKVGGVPGCRGFFEAVKTANVDVYFVSNRLDKNKDSLIQILRHVFGDALPNEWSNRLFLKHGSESSKKVRFEEIVNKHPGKPLLMIGDSVGDLDGGLDNGAFRAESRPWQARKERFDLLSRGKVGVSWFVLPNPVYGDWQRVLPKSFETRPDVLSTSRSPANH